MATPVDDHYAAASGTVIAGGRYHWPAWRRAMAPMTTKTAPPIVRGAAEKGETHEP